MDDELKRVAVRTAEALSCANLPERIWVVCNEAGKGGSPGLEAMLVGLLGRAAAWYRGIEPDMAALEAYLGSRGDGPPE